MTGRRRRRFGIVESTIYACAGREALLAFWAQRRDAYNAEKRQARDARRAEIVRLWNEVDPTLGCWRLADHFGVTVRTVKRDLAALKKAGFSKPPHPK
jgi:hypothetical protein